MTHSAKHVIFPHTSLMALLSMKGPADVPWATADEFEIAEKWLVCLYIDVLPIQTTLRIWDCLLYEGHKVIFRVALALFGIRSERVRESKNLPDFVDALNHFHQDKRVVNCHHFMSVSNYSVNKGHFRTFSNYRTFFIRHSSDI